MSRVDETIVAIASPPGAAVRGIVRVSGPDAVSILRKVFRSAADPALTDLQTRTVLHGECLFATGQWIEVIALVWPDQRSYTRQPTVELQTVGSMPIVEAIVQQVCRCGARLAEPGEFTMRAFLAGRIDLTQAEAVLAAIDAESDRQFEAAMNQLAGGLAGPLQELRDQLLFLLAELEAGLDFVEEDIEFISSSQLQSRLKECQTQLQTIIAQIRSRDSADELPRVALVGQPNAGKSSLLNCLSASEQAIVTPIAGTTTDFVTARVELVDQQAEVTQSIHLVDTAGAEQAKDEIMVQAQSHRQQQATQADCRVLCIDAARWLSTEDGSAYWSWNREEANKLQPSDIVLLTKLDQVSSSTAGLAEHVGEQLGWSGSCLAVSVSSGVGLEELQALLLQKLSAATGDEGSVVATTVRRAAESLIQAERALAAAVQANQSSLGEEIVAAEIRETLHELANVVGEVYTDDILDVVFGKFCIGK